MGESITKHWAEITVVFAGLVRIVESVMVLQKNQKGINIINIIKEFFKLS